MIWVYEFDPELGDSLKMEAKYERGIERMKTENRVMITENVTPVSHREKRLTRVFPLSQENM
ncbi:MAG TPA: hypothetical protein ENH82_07310 [bacterium]|nr:hypothetical protein [bacterium]